MGTGGRRCGAGRPAGRGRAEHCRHIDVRRWHREGMLRNGSGGSWQWSDPETGEMRAVIGYRADEFSVALSYSVNGRDCSQRVWLGESACNYGGKRPWFLCPIGGERVAVLYLRGSRFACRHCQRLAYASQGGNALSRGWQRQHRTEAKLDDDWQRPKGMHHATHVRLLSILVNIVEARDAALGHYLTRMMERYPTLRSDPLFSELT